MSVAKLLLSSLVGLAAASIANPRTITLTVPRDAGHAFGNFVTRAGAPTDYFAFKSSGASDLSRPVDALSSFVSPISDSRTPFSSSSFIIRVNGKHWLAPSVSAGHVSDIAPVSNVRAAAVPAQDSWMMLVVGIGLVGSLLRRKQKSLQHPLAT